MGASRRGGTRPDAGDRETRYVEDPHRLTYGHGEAHPRVPRGHRGPDVEAREGADAVVEVQYQLAPEDRAHLGAGEAFDASSREGGRHLLAGATAGRLPR